MEEVKRELFGDVPVNLVLWDVALYYLGTSLDRRSKHSGPSQTFGRYLTGAR